LLVALEEKPDDVIRREKKKQRSRPRHGKTCDERKKAIPFVAMGLCTIDFLGKKV
jgi:hypothetical protein